MANDLVYRVNGDTSGFKSSMEDAAESTEKFDDATRKASEDVGKMGRKIDEVSDQILKEISAMEKRNEKTSNYRQQLGYLTKKITDLTVRYREMTDAEKNSAKGREIFQKLEELKAKAANIKDAIGDVNSEISLMASDTANLDAFNQIIDAAAAGVQAYTASVGLANVDTQKLTQTLATLAQIQTVVNAATKLMNIFNKSSIAYKAAAAVATRLQTALIKKETVEKVKNTAATEVATVAQRKFNAAAMMNPYVILATAVIAVGYAIYEFTQYLNDSNEELEKSKERTDSLKRSTDEFKDTVAKTTANAVSGYRKLQTEYTKLSTKASKTEWIKKNANELKQLGIVVRNVTEADDMFIKNSDKVIEAFRKRAQATAIQNVLTEVYEKSYRDMLDLDEQYAREHGGNMNTVYRDDIEAYKKYQEKRKAIEEKANKTAASLQSSISSLNSSADSTLGTNRTAPEKNSKTTDKEKELQKKFEELKKSRDYLLNDLINLNFGVSGGVKIAESYMPKLKENAQEIKNYMMEAFGKTELQAIAEMTDDVTKFYATVKQGRDLGWYSYDEEAQKIGMIQDLIRSFPAIPPEYKQEEARSFVDDMRDKYEAFKREYSQIHTDLEIGVIGEKEAIDKIAALNKRIAMWKLKPLPVDVTITTKESKAITEYEILLQKAQDLQDRYDLGLISKENATKQLQELNEQVGNLHIKRPVMVDLKVNTDELDLDFEGLQTLGTMSDTVMGLSDSLESLSERWDELSDSERFKGVIEGFFNTVDAVKSCIDAYHNMCSVIEALNALKAVEVAVDNSSTNTEIANSQAKSAQNSVETGTEVTKAAAKAFSAHSWIPWVGVAIGAAMVAMLIAQMSSVKSKKYANGGYVKGNTTVGDKIPAMLNANELVLNSQQQGRMWRMLNGQMAPQNSQLEGNVKFEIEGTKLYGVLQNFEKKKARI